MKRDLILPKRRLYDNQEMYLLSKKPYIPSKEP